MHSGLVAYEKHLKERRVRHICKMERLEIRAIIKYFCTKRMPSRVIHEDYMEIFWKESPSYSISIKWAAEFKRGERAFVIMEGLAGPNMPPLIKLSRSCTPWLLVIGCETCES